MKGSNETIGNVHTVVVSKFYEMKPPQVIKDSINPTTQIPFS